MSVRLLVVSRVLIAYSIWVFYVQSFLYIWVHLICMTPPILHKMVPVYIVSYVPLWVHLMYTDYYRVLLLYIRWSLYRVLYILLWVHLMYTDQCMVLLLYIRWSLCIECHMYYYGSILCTPIIVGSYSYMVSYVLLWAHLMYTDYYRVLLLYIRWSLYIVSYYCGSILCTPIIVGSYTPVHKRWSVYREKR